jgi:hypothetical protein
VRLPLSSVACLQPQLKTQILKAAFLSGNPTSEIVFASFEFPLAAFSKQRPGFKPERLATVRFVFDRSPSGVIILDNLGFRRSDIVSGAETLSACSADGGALPSNSNIERGT